MLHARRVMLRVEVESYLAQVHAICVGLTRNLYSYHHALGGRRPGVDVVGVQLELEGEIQVAAYCKSKF